MHTVSYGVGILLLVCDWMVTIITTEAPKQGILLSISHFCILLDWLCSDRKALEIGLAGIG